MDYASLTDKQLIALLQKDDELAFAAIYNRYAATLTGFAATKLFSLAEAGDIIHDLFVYLWENRLHLNIVELKAYLFVWVRRRIIDQIRKNVTRETYADRVQCLANRYENSTEQIHAVKELQQTIAQSLLQLSPRVREVYELSRNQGLDIPSIAAQLQLSEQTVKNQLTTALRHLRQCLKFTAAALVFWWY